MPRKNLIRTNIFPYHITTRSNNKEWFDLPLSEVWKICIDSLAISNKKHNIELISFVLMNNHYHLILNTPNSNLDSFMYELNKNISLRLRAQTGRINQMFGGRYKWCLIKSQMYLKNCYRYVYQNPLRANIVSRCEDYPYSTLYSICKKKSFIIPINDQFCFKDEFGLKWLNEQVSPEETLATKMALKKRELIKIIDSKKKKMI